MARYTGPSCRLCRREGAKLFLKGDRCYGGKCAFTKRPNPPGQHKQMRRKVSEYGLQLREKQKIRRVYGVLEGQFRSYFDKASKKRGVTGENLLQLLECRMDNTVYRMGFGESRAQARQLVLHGHFQVNGRRVDIPSYQMKAGDVVTVASGSRDIEVFKALREGASRPLPQWVELKADELEGRISALPQREDIDMSFSEHLVVEFYSKL